MQVCGLPLQAETMNLDLLWLGKNQLRLFNKIHLVLQYLVFVFEIPELSLDDGLMTGTGWLDTHHRKT